MTDCRRSRKNEYCWNHIKGLLLINSMVFMYGSRTNSLVIESNHVNCSEFQTCKTCTNINGCTWSLIQQTCDTDNKNRREFIVYTIDYCTQFLIPKKSVALDINNYSFSVKISNDYYNFIPFLRKSNIICHIESIEVEAMVNNDEIICNPVRFHHKFYLDIFFVFVTFNKKQIKFDQEIDYYQSVYQNDCENIKNDKCVTCLWKENDYQYIFGKCLKSIQCNGLIEIYGKRAINNLHIGYIPDNIQVECPEIKINSIEPLYGLYTGGTTVKITVKNHGILVENKIMVVTVAGRNCADPLTINNEMITCTITTSNFNVVGEGPVQVLYGLTKNLTVTSEQTFRFVDPSITSISLVCDPVKGETLLNMTGEYLDASSGVRVFTGENVTCETIAVDQDRILCKTAPSHKSTTYQIKVEYDQLLWMYVKNTLFVYSSEPTLDAGQSFEGMVSGETTVPVRGNNFSCMKNVSFYVDLDDTRYTAGCRVKNDTYMVCRSPRLSPLTVPNTASMPLNYGIRAHYMDHVVDLSPQPDHHSFTLCPDPEYVDFELHNRSVDLINENCVMCLWNDNDYKYFLRKCLKSNQCNDTIEIYEKRAINNLTISFTPDNIQAMCPEIKINSIEPLYGLYTGGTTVKITVENHEILVENKIMVVTVAGRNCADPVTLNNETITCTIETSNISVLGEGPVKVLYGLTKNLTVTSEQTFRFVDPSITSISLVCDPVKGETLFNMTGKYLDASDGVRVFTGKNVTCETIVVDQDRILCKMDHSHKPTTNQIKVEYNQYFWTYVENTSFVYSGDFTLDAGQSFEGIVSGETTVPVRGNSFLCMKNVSFYVDLDSTRYTTGCRVENDTYMVCRSPKLGPLTAPITAPMPLNFGLRAHYMDHVVDLSPRPDYHSFTLYPDPVYVDFEINNRSVVVINGHNMDRGYQADDMKVRFRNRTGDCAITRIARDRIVCESNSPDVVLGDLSEIVVALGDSLLIIVQNKSTRNENNFVFFYGENVKYEIAVAAVGILILIFVSVSYIIVLRCRSKTANQNYNVSEYNSTNLSPICELQELHRNKHTDE